MIGLQRVLSPTISRPSPPCVRVIMPTPGTRVHAEQKGHHSQPIPSWDLRHLRLVTIRDKELQLHICAHKSLFLKSLLCPRDRPLSKAGASPARYTRRIAVHGPATLGLERLTSSRAPGQGRGTSWVS